MVTLREKKVRLCNTFVVRLVLRLTTLKTTEPAWYDAKLFISALNFSQWDKKKWTLSELDLVAIEIGWPLSVATFPKQLSCNVHSYFKQAVLLFYWVSSVGYVWPFRECSTTWNILLGAMPELVNDVQVMHVQYVVCMCKCLESANP